MSGGSTGAGSAHGRRSATATSGIPVKGVTWLAGVSGGAGVCDNGGGGDGGGGGGSIVIVWHVSMPPLVRVDPGAVPTVAGTVLTSTPLTPAALLLSLG